MEPQTVIDILERWLKEHGYDGLYDPGECSCELDDLMPCESYSGHCLPGYKCKCPRLKPGESNHCIGADKDGNCWIDPDDEESGCPYY